MLRRLLREETGQGMTEYALIIGVVAVAAIAILWRFREQISAIFGNLLNSLGTATEDAIRVGEQR